MKISAKKSSGSYPNIGYMWASSAFCNSVGVCIGSPCNVVAPCFGPVVCSTWGGWPNAGWQRLPCCGCGHQHRHDGALLQLDACRSGWSVHPRRRRARAVDATRAVAVRLPDAVWFAVAVHYHGVRVHVHVAQSGACHVWWTSFSKSGVLRLAWAGVCLHDGCSCGCSCGWCCPLCASVRACFGSRGN